MGHQTRRAKRLELDESGVQGYEAELTEAALIHRIDLAWNWSKRISKLQYPKARETANSTPEQIEAWSELVDYLDRVIEIAKAALNIKIAARLAKLSHSEREVEKRRLISECDRRYRDDKIYYYEEHFSKSEALKSIREARADVTSRMESFCIALRAFEFAEQSELWPQRAVNSNTPTKHKTKRSRAPIEKSVKWRQRIYTILVGGGGELSAMNVARRIDPNEDVVPDQYRGDGTVKTLDQILKKDRKLMKRFGNLVSDVRGILKG